MDRIRVNYIISKTAKNLLIALSSKLGLKHTSLIEIAIRELAKKEEITLE